MSSVKEQKIQEALNRGVENIYPSREALKKVLASRKLRIYTGIDPTGPRLHLGHSVQLLKLRQFQELGHHIIVLIGDFTAQIGDPTGKLSERKMLTHQQVLQNAKSYKAYIGKILDMKKTEIKYNSKWLDGMSSLDFVNLTRQFTAQQTLARGMFQKRMKEGKDLYVNEFLYPMMQAYDSVAMNIDLEIGGNDQMFNMLAGRTLMKKMKGKEKFVLTTRLLEDPSGKKMGKTEGNFVALDDKSSDMYSKIMSWPDEMILVGLEIATQVPLTKVVEIKQKMKSGQNPKNAKMFLAYKIVELYHGKTAAISAEEQFKKVFESKDKPDSIPTVKVQSKDIVDVLVNTKLASSKSEARRLLKQGGVKVNDTVVKEGAHVSKGSVIQKGKRHFVKIG